MADLENGDYVTGTVPLCIDLDGTLVRTDMLHEALLNAAKQKPLALFKALCSFRGGKANFKYHVGELSELDVSHLPYREDVLSLIEKARAEGRRIVLATAAAPQIAHAIADHLELFNEVLCSDKDCNLSSNAKAERLIDRFGEQGFDYVGNHRDDLAVWRAARNIIVVSNSKSLFQRAARNGQPAIRIVDKQPIVPLLLRSLRPHQWLKNLLIFVPLLAAHHLGDLTYLLNAILAVIVFSGTASAVYILNDLFDLQEDRTHRSKNRRPFACGELTVVAGLVMVPALLISAFVMALLLPPLFMATLLVYILLTSAYSFRLKRQVIMDVILLAGLYTIRVIAGSASTQIFPSFWLLSFSMFLFFSLALVKRYTELLHSSAKTSALPGRGYKSQDMAVLMALGTSSAIISVLVLALYIDSPQVVANYNEPLWLWLLPPAMLYWTARLWMKTERAEVHDDPVIFALRDRQSLLIILLLAPAVAAAKIGWQPWL